MSIGRRIKLSRHSLSLSLRDLEARIDNRVTAQAISKYERDELIPSSDVLIALANALGVSVHYLVSETDIKLTEVNFRKKHLASRKEEAEVEAKVLDLLERYLTVEEILGLPTVNADLPRNSPWRVLHDLVEVEQMAYSLRNHWGLGLGPISNLVELVEDRGIKILSIPLNDIDGLTAKVCRGDKSVASVIVVNKSNAGDRQRFTIAHELGHIILEVVASDIDNENAANRFAGAFLIPAETLRAEIGGSRTSVSLAELFRLKRIFGVSVQALTYRCRELGIFSNALFKLLFEEFQNLGWRTPPFREPYSVKREIPRRFERLCFRALTERAITESKAAELLEISVHELTRIINGPPNEEEDLSSGDTSD